MPAKSTDRKFPTICRPEPGYDLRNLIVPGTQGATGWLKKGFETRVAARKEDVVRLKSLAQYLESGRVVGYLPRHTGWETFCRIAIASRAPERLKTFASSYAMRDLRRRLTGEVLRHIATAAEVRLFTVIVPGRAFCGSDLHDFDPRAYREAIRMQLHRQGLSDLPGWFIGHVHGEYDPTSDTFVPHLHGVAVGEKAHAFDALRTLDAFRPTDRIKRPIRLLRLKEPARQIAYHVLQAYWPRKYRGNGAGPGCRMRLPEPLHAEWLLWADRKSFADIVWLHGCAIRDRHLVILNDLSTEPASPD